MTNDIAVLAAQVMPYVTSAVGAYGGAVLADIKDEAADATVSLGRRVLRRLFGARPAEELPESLADVLRNPDDADATAALRLVIRKALEADAGLKRDLIAMLPPAGISVTASGDRAIAAQSVSGVASTGDATTIHQTNGPVNHTYFILGNYNVQGSSVHPTGTPSVPADKWSQTTGSAPGKVIQIATLLPPKTGSILEGQTFEDIHFFGPAMVIPMNGIIFDECIFDIPNNNIDDILFAIQPRYIVGVIGLRACVFRRCRFSGIGFMGDGPSLDSFKAGIPLRPLPSSSLPRPT